jgi:hypothetical protein
LTSTTGEAAPASVSSTLTATAPGATSNSRLGPACQAMGAPSSPMVRSLYSSGVVGAGLSWRERERE